MIPDAQVVDTHLGRERKRRPQLLRTAVELCDWREDPDPDAIHW